MHQIQIELILTSAQVMIINNCLRMCIRLLILYLNYVSQSLTDSYLFAISNFVTEAV